MNTAISFTAFRKISFALRSIASGWVFSAMFSALMRASMARRGRFMVVNDRFPRPKEVFSPFRFSNTRVRHPMVANS